MARATKPGSAGGLRAEIEPHGRPRARASLRGGPERSRDRQRPRPHRRRHRAAPGSEQGRSPAVHGEGTQPPMTDVEKLTLRWIAGGASADEARELEQLIAGDPAARSVHFAFLDLEGRLQAQRPVPDVSEAVVRTIEEAREGRIVAGVSRRIRRRRLVSWLAVFRFVSLAAAASLLMVLS